MDKVNEFIRRDASLRRVAKELRTENIVPFVEENVIEKSDVTVTDEIFDGAMKIMHNLHKRAENH